MRIRSPEFIWSFSRWCHRQGWKRGARIVKTLNWAIHKCLLPSEAVVGNDIVLEHYALGIVMHPQVKIGDRCRIFHHVTIAAESCIGSEHFVIIEDDVMIGAHAVVIARSNSTLVIARGASIGAGSVLTKSVPAGEVWAGNPARRIGEVGSRQLAVDSRQ